MQATGNAPLAGTSRAVVLKIVVVVVLTVLATTFYTGTAHAETFTVTNTANGGAGSLREAITKANAAAGADEVAFADAVGGTITLASQLPTITDPAGLAIDGGGDVAVSGNGSGRVFTLGRGAQLALRNVTVENGHATVNLPQGGGPSSTAEARSR